MSTSRRAFALHLSGYSLSEIERELNLSKGRVQVCILQVQMEWEVAYGKTIKANA